MSGWPDGLLEALPEEGLVSVERTVAMRAHGASLQAVAASLDADGIPDPLGPPVGSRHAPAQFAANCACEWVKNGRKTPSTGREGPCDEPHPGARARGVAGEAQSRVGVGVRVRRVGARRLERLLALGRRPVNESGRAAAGDPARRPRGHSLARRWPTWREKGGGSLLGCGIYPDGRAALEGVDPQVLRRHDKCLLLSHFDQVQAGPKEPDHRESVGHF